MEHPATLVILTVNEHETRALLESFIGTQVAETRIINGTTYNLLGTHGDATFVHTISEMGSGTLGGSQQRAHEAILHWQPRAVIAVGIAFGMDETKQKIGDVLVATQVQDYELARVGEKGQVLPRGDKPGSSDGLRQRLRQIDQVESRTQTDWPKMRFGLLLSGAKLVDDADYRESLKKLHPEAIGGEMEATGIYVAAAKQHTDWIVIKAICDWGANKNNTNKEDWQRTAARNAARVLKAMDAGRVYAPNSSGRKEPPSRDAGKTSELADILTRKLELLRKELATARTPEDRIWYLEQIRATEDQIRSCEAAGERR